MREADRKTVRGLALFAQMRETNFRALMNAALLQSFPPRTPLAREGERPEHLLVLMEGAAEQVATHRDRETTLAVVAPVTPLMVAAAIGDTPCLQSARTLVESRVLLLPAEAVRDVFDRDQAFARAVAVELAARHCGMVRALKNQKLRTATERLANWILCMDQRCGEAGQFLLPFEKRLLASLLGMTPENLSRSFSALAAHGVASEGRAIRIRDREALRRHAVENPLIDDRHDLPAPAAQHP